MGNLLKKMLILIEITFYRVYFMKTTNECVQNAFTEEKKMVFHFIFK